MPELLDIDPAGDAELLALGAELNAALQQPWLSGLDRARIHARAVEIAEGHGHGGFRRAWPQLAAHPAMVGGAAAAVLALAGLVALRERRGHGAASVLRAA